MLGIPASFFSVDPGGKLLGWALWYGKELVACGLSDIETRLKISTLQQRARFHREHLRGTNHLALDWVLSERMTGRGKMSAVDPQDLIDLNLIAGRVGTHWVAPADWKGGLPPAKELERTRGRLSPAELAIAEAACTRKKDVHVWSAIGIGLYGCNRGWLPLNKKVWDL